jgi:hypothetical protein
MKKRYGDLVCRKRGNTFVVRPEKSSVERNVKDMDTFTLMMAMWVLENYLATEDDPLLAADIVLRHVKDHIKEVMSDQPVG